MTPSPVVSRKLLPLCNGTSPAGIQWLYAQPAVTGTQTVVQYIHDTVGIVSCVHSHLHHNAPFVFTFVANPFRRVLNLAAFRGVIHGGRGWLNEPSTHNGTHEDDVQRFFKWLQPRRQPFPSYLKTSSKLNIRFIGCVNSLQRDLQAVLAFLGYGNRSVRFPSSQTHCATDCGQDDFSDWYDAKTESRVAEWYAEEFRRFGFSHRSKDMYDKCEFERWPNSPIGEERRPSVAPTTTRARRLLDLFTLQPSLRHDGLQRLRNGPQALPWQVYAGEHVLVTRGHACQDSTALCKAERLGSHKFTSRATLRSNPSTKIILKWAKMDKHSQKHAEDEGDNKEEA